jgi:hypothetical protein
MSIARSVAEILSEHVTLQLESIDRMHLNVYVPRLQSERIAPRRRSSSATLAAAGWASTSAPVDRYNLPTSLAHGASRQEGFMGLLSGKAAIVTGASSPNGIGRAIARRLAQERSSLLAWQRRPGAVQEAASSKRVPGARWIWGTRRTWRIRSC